MRKLIKGVIFILTALLCAFMPLCIASADTGPKPTLEIKIKNLVESDYVIAFEVKKMIF